MLKIAAGFIVSTIDDPIDKITKTLPITRKDSRVRKCQVGRDLACDEPAVHGGKTSPDVSHGQSARNFNYGSELRV
jgi:hypothetical protein